MFDFIEAMQWLCQIVFNIIIYWKIYGKKKDKGLFEKTKDKVADGIAVLNGDIENKEYYRHIYSNLAYIVIAYIVFFGLGVLTACGAFFCAGL